MYLYDEGKQNSRLSNFLAPNSAFQFGKFSAPVCTAAYETWLILPVLAWQVIHVPTGRSVPVLGVPVVTQFPSVVM